MVLFTASWLLKFQAVACRVVDDGVVFPKEHSISFDVPATPELLQLFGELTKKRRFPRKFKKAVKALMAKRYGISMKKIKFSYK